MAYARSTLENFLNRQLDEWDFLKSLPEKELDKQIKSFWPTAQFKLKPFKHQKVAILLGIANPGFLYLMDMGTGKDQPLDSKILTPRGWVKMGDVEVGDTICHPFEGTSTIQAIMPQGERDIYRVHFEDGSFAECGEEHLWSIYTPAMKYQNGLGFKKYTNKVWPLKKIVENGLQDSCIEKNNKYFIPITNPLEFPEQPLRLHPYIVGVLLGDGSTNGGAAIFTSMDPEIADKFERCLPEGYQLNSRPNSKNPEDPTKVYSAVRINRDYDSLRNLVISEGLKGTSHTKRIPQKYLFNSIEMRRELLQGLIDTDGHVCKNGGCDYTTVSEGLKDDVVFLVQSLGGTCKTKSFVNACGNETWNCRIILPNLEDYVHLTRKKERASLRTGKYGPSRSFNHVEYVGKKHSQCISVSAEDGLYITDNCVVTHNSASSLWAHQYNVEYNGAKRLLIVVPNEVAAETWKKEIKLFTNFKAVALIGTKAEREALLRKKSDIYIINYAGLQVFMTEIVKVKKSKKGKRMPVPEKILEFTSKFDSVIFDEIHACFHRDTAILGNFGKKKISEVLVGDKVKTLEGVFSEVVNKFENKVFLEDLCKVAGEGFEICCTRDHKFFTDSGWKKAEDLEGEFVVLSELSYNAAKITGGGCETAKRKVFGKKLRALREDISSTTCKKRRSCDSKKILQRKMCGILEESASACGRIEKKSRKNKKAASGSRKILEFRKRHDCSKSLFRKNAGEQSFEKSRNCQEGFRDERSERNTSRVARREGRKWKVFQTTTGTFCSPSRNRLKLGARVRSKNGTQHSRSKRISSSLQTGSRLEENLLRHRGGRESSQYEVGSIKRQEERGKVSRVRVESVEVFQRGNNEKSFESFISDKEKAQGFCKFYDLAVAQHPSYYANSVLVHNCKNKDSTTFQLADYLSESCRFRYGLTGTPFGRDPLNLWAQFYLTDRGETLGNRIELFRDSYFNKEAGYFGASYSLDKRKEQKLFTTLKHRSIRYEAGECGDLPELVKIPVPLKMHPDALTWYQKMLEEFMAHEESEVGAKATSFIKMRQIMSGFLYVENKETGEKHQMEFAHNPKLEYLEGLIEQIDSDEKIVIFHEFTKSCDLICKLLDSKKIKYEKLNGETKDPAKALTNFQKKKDVRCFIVNSKSGSSNLNLQVARYMVFFESPVSPIIRAQAEKRCHRTGQERKVFIYDLFIRKSVEERVHEFLREGKDLTEALLKGKQNMLPKAFFTD